jgi:hypothetical protein
VRAARDLLPAAIEEILRFRSPVPIGAVARNVGRAT